MRHIPNKQIFGNIWKALTPTVAGTILAAAQTNWMMNERQFLGIYWLSFEKTKTWSQWKSVY
jgi:hypothetical protein